MKVEYIKSHSSGNRGKIAEVSDSFGHYLIISGHALQLTNKKDKSTYKTKDDVSK
ncbi:MAG: hypothetical protein WC380_00260 [Pedobacter sp.]